jgi:hypothetical protein
VAVSFAAIVVGLVACGGGPSAACGNYFDQLVAQEQKCDPGVQIDPSLKTNFENVCDALGRAPGTNNLAGQIDACANQLSNSACGASVNCKIAGSLPDGSACGTGVQCAGSLCDNTTQVPNSELTCGKCASYLAVGATCGTANTGQCDPAISACNGGKCVALAQQGQDCTTTPCANGLTCDQTAKTCQPPPPLPTKGATCQFVCASPYKCIAQVCADAVQAGGACPTGLECASNLTCNPQTKTCVQPTLAPAGQPCGFVNNQVVSCQSGLECKQGPNSQGTCVAPKLAGDACTVGQGECATFLFCINGTCGVPDYSVCK